MNSIVSPLPKPRDLKARLITVATLFGLSLSSSMVEGSTQAGKAPLPVRPAGAAINAKKTTPPAPEPANKTSVKGPADAPIRVLEFADFMCPGCQAASQALKSYFAQQTRGDLNLTFKNFPLEKTCNPSMFRTIHNGACELALGSICAAEQGLFWPYHDRIFSRSWEQATRADVLEHAGAAGLDKIKLEACMNSSAANSKLALQIKEGVEAQVQVTPTLLVNGRKLVATSQFASAVEEERKKLAESSAAVAIPSASPKK